MQEYAEREREHGFTLMINWPPLGDPVAGKALEKFVEMAPIGSHVFYWGEFQHGCCATDDFFKILDRNFELVRTYDILRWPEICDGAEMYRLRSK